MPTFALVITLLGWTIVGVLDKKASETMSAATVGFVYGAAEIVLLPIYYGLLRDKITLVSFTKAGVAWSVLASLVGMVTWFSYFVALRHFEASRIAAYALGDVAAMCVLGALFLHEPITLSKAGGIALMAAGAWILGR